VKIVDKSKVPRIDCSEFLMLILALSVCGMLRKFGSIFPYETEVESDRLDINCTEHIIRYR